MKKWKTGHLLYEIKEVKPVNIGKNRSNKAIALVVSGMKTTYPLEIVLKYEMVKEWIEEMVIVYGKEEIERELNISIK